MHQKKEINFMEMVRDAATQLRCHCLLSLENDDLASALIKLEGAWQMASKDGSSNVTLEKKEQILQELQDWYYKEIYVKKNPENFNDPLFFQVFEKIVEKNPNQLALIYQENIKWSYHELNEKINKVAHKLIELKEQYKWEDESRVALFFENSPEAVICIIAAMKAGLAYVPLTSGKNSKERLIHYIKASDVKLVIVQDKLISHDLCDFIKKETTPNFLSYSEVYNEEKNSSNPNVVIQHNQLAYILFSSGSTGHPKGIKIAHRGLSFPAHAVCKKFDIKPDDRIGWHSALTFDASLLDIMTPLVSGATLVPIPQDIRTNTTELEAYMNALGITIMTLVPTVIEVLDPNNLPLLRGYISTGERGKDSHFIKFDEKGRLGKKRIGINGYGVSEATICNSLGTYESDKGLNIGENPIEGMEWYILELPEEQAPYPRAPKLVRNTEQGELYLVGKGVGLGYLDSNADYQRRFRAIPHPDPAQREKMLWVYQTGDVVQREGKNVKFVKRINNEYKFLGELVHPEAIEKALLEYEIDRKPIISKACVTIEAHKNPSPVLQAYIQIPEVEVDNALIRKLFSYLKRHSYINIAPSRFNVLKKDQEWPINANKNNTDQKELVNKKWQVFYPTHPFFLEAKKVHYLNTIKPIWLQQLQIPTNTTISLDDNFYEQGGKSIHVSALLEAIKIKHPNYEKNITQFNACPTLRALIFRVSQLYDDSKFYHQVEWHNGKTFLKKNMGKDCYPIVLINAITGDSSGDYKNIINCWHEKMSPWPLLSTKCLSLKHPGYIVSSIAELAADYVKALKKDPILQNYDGPILFIGYSAGGTLAYEIAKQLQIKYRQQAMTLCLDAPSANYYNNLLPDQYANEIYALMLHMSQIMDVTPENMREVITLEDLQKHGKRKQLEIFWQNFMEKYSTTSDEDKKKYLGFYATIHNLSQPMFDYEPKPIKGVTLLSFTETQKKCQDEYLGWAKELPINHLNMEAKHLSVVDDLGWVKSTLMPKIKEICEYSLANMVFQSIFEENKEQYSKFPSDDFVNLIFTSNKYQANAASTVVEKEEITLETLLPQANEHILILGLPGIGKTKLCQYIASQWAKENSAGIFVMMRFYF